MSEVIEAALKYAEAGWYVIPVKFDKDQNGKVKKPPLIRDWQTRATRDPDEIRRWWAKWPDAGIAIHAGKSKLAVVDIDPRNGGTVETASDLFEGGNLERVQTLSAETGGGGRHYVFQITEQIANLTKTPVPGVDLITGDNYFVVAPSHNPYTGKPYVWRNGFDLMAWGIDLLLDIEPFPTLKGRSEVTPTPAEVHPVTDADNWVNDERSPPDTPEEHDRVLSALQCIPSDCDRDAWIRVLMALHWTGWACANDLARDWSERNYPEFSEREFAGQWASFGKEKRDPNARVVTLGTLFRIAKGHGWADPRGVSGSDGNQPDGGREDATDAGNAHRLVRITGGDLAYVPELKDIRTWDGKAWQTGPWASSQAHNYALLVGQSWIDESGALEKEAQNAPDEPTRRALLAAAKGKRDWGRYCRSKKGIDNMLALAVRDSRLIVSMHEWDANPCLMGVANGVVDLRNGHLRPEGRDDRVSKRTPYPYDPTAECPLWEKTIPEATGSPDGKGYFPRPALARHLQKLFGYFCTGLTREQIMVMFTGEGANCKSIIVDTVLHAMGPYSTSITTDVLMTSKGESAGDRPMPTIAALNGVRLAVASESTEGAKLDVAMVKRHTGGGYITAHAKHQNPVTFEMTHKLLLLTNHLPNLANVDPAITGRLQIIPFERTWNRPGHPNPDPDLPDGDPTLAEKLRAESVGILRWLVQGAVAYFKEGLTLPDEVRVKTNTYLTAQGHIGRWLDDYEKCSARDGTMAAELYQQFREWGKHIDNLQPNTTHRFGRELGALGIERAQVSKGVKWGLRVG